MRACKKLNPKLVYCSITGFGQDGPYAPRAGYDFIVQGMSGLMSITGPAGGEPQKVGVAVTDLFTGLYSVIAIQAALRHAEATGQGQHIDMALLDAQISVLANQNLNFLVSGNPPVQMGNAHPNIAPYEVVQAADGHFILAIGNDGQFQKFCKVVGLDDLPQDPDFATNAARVANRVRLREKTHRSFAAARTRPAAGEARRCRRAGEPDQQHRRDVRRPAGRGARHAHGPRRRPRQSAAFGALAHALVRNAARLSAPLAAAWRTHGRNPCRTGEAGQMKTGGQLIVDALEANGVERIFCVPGESYLPVLDALHDSPIRTIVCRQEGGAAMMADCEGKLTGRPGICFVTRGPGATNASAGVHIAMQDSSPMILFIGQVARGIKEREAWQEVDYKRFFGGIAKWAVEIDDAARIPELVTRAFAVATSGRPGPVVIALPEDVLTDQADAPAAQHWTPVETRPGDVEMGELENLLGAAKRPFAILGGSRWSEASVPRSKRRRRPGRCLSASPSAGRCCSTICTRTMPAISALAPTRRFRRRSGTPTSCCSSAAASAKCPRRIIRC